jgi:hypothetical protein
MPLAHPKDALPARQPLPGSRSQAIPWPSAVRERTARGSERGRQAAAKGIERRVALLAHRHVNKDAAPEMYRLPIQAGHIPALAKMQHYPVKPSRQAIYDRLAGYRDVGSGVDGSCCRGQHAPLRGGS